MSNITPLTYVRLVPEAVELWGGVECTVNRVGETYRDQTVLTGHDRRLSDLDLLPPLGIRALRYPVLWERVAPAAPDDCDWSWSDERLARLRALGIRPIVGLVHHGSGPRYTSLVDDGFATGLAAFAGKVAARYPWVEAWTPVNEPVTTARFSALYGHWFPHGRDDRQFVLALLNQIDATRLAMAAIRRVNPKARLVQTDDLGQTYATAPLSEQAAFDNARRWLGWDLLCGRVTPGHALWGWLAGLGFEGRLRAIAEAPCPPDVIGINHYLTSTRFLDHRVQRYPPAVRGGNGRIAYADVEACRVLDPPPVPFSGVIEEAWARYGLPLALTEVHNGCSREEQLRWFAEACRAAGEARARGVDLRAVTSWALFGSVGWDTLLTGGGRYEEGAFDVRSGTPRPTALARMLSSATAPRIAATSAPAAGWWRRDLRLHHPPVRVPARVRDWSGSEGAAPAGRPILVTGATGTLGQAVAAACRHRALPFVLTGREALDLHDRASIAAALHRHRPWVVIDCSGFVRVDDAEECDAACMALNAAGAAALAAACAAEGIASVHFSSDLVFGGCGSQGPFAEGDAPSPLNVYGRSKAAMEEAVLALPGDHLVIRTAAFFSPYDRHNFAIHLAEALAGGRRFAAASDSIVSPTYVPDLANAVLDLALDGETGLWHLANGEAASWAGFAARLAEALGHDPGRIDAVASAALGWRAPRPAASALVSERGQLLPPLQNAIERFAATLAARPGEARRCA